MDPVAPHSNAGGLSAVTYGSEAGPLLQDPFLLADIVARMRPSNANLNVTGALACESGLIHQWIEGPEAAVAMLWDRIRLDPRHRLQWATPPAVVTDRHFPGSPMKLALTTASLAQLDPCLIDDVVSLPQSLGQPRRSAWSDTLEGDAADGAGQRSGAMADAFRRLDPSGRADALRLAEARGAALADVLTNTDPRVARGYLDTVLRQSGLTESAGLIQAVLDRVQAQWMDGLISAWQRQLAVAMLQSALRLRLDVAESAQSVGSALVSALPGTPDMCGVILKVALLRRAGWSVRLLLPQSVHEIQITARHLQPDLVVLAGSRLSARPQEQAMLADVLPALVVQTAAPIVLGGKLAETDPHRMLRLGASAVCGTLSWIATIASDHAPPTPFEQGGCRGGALLASDALAALMPANRNRNRSPGA